MKNNTINNIRFQPSLNHFNLERMNKYLDNDEFAIKEILLIVISDIKLSLTKLENCIYTKNIAQIGAISHNLFGTSATIGLEELSKIARLIERETAFNEIVLAKLFKKLKAEIILVTDLMNNYIYNKSF